VCFFARLSAVSFVAVEVSLFQERKHYLFFPHSLKELSLKKSLQVSGCFR